MRPEHWLASNFWPTSAGTPGGRQFLSALVHPPVLLWTPWSKGFLRRDPAVQRFPDLFAYRPGRCCFARVKGRTVTPAQVPQLRVTVEDGLYERPATRSVPGGLAREGRPILARYLFGLDLELQLALVSGSGGGELRRESSNDATSP